MRDRRQKASKGVVIFSSILILIGSVNFIAIIVSLFLLHLEQYIPGLFSYLPHSTINSSIFWLSTIVSILIMLCWTVAGIGMLLLQEWARQLLLVSLGVYFINALINIFINLFMAYEYLPRTPISYLTIGVVFVLTFSISLVHFFTHPDIIRQFKKNKKVFS